MDTRDSIQEFNENFNLINQCVGEDLTTEEIRLFEAVLKEREVKY